MHTLPSSVVSFSAQWHAARQHLEWRGYEPLAAVTAWPFSGDVQDCDPALGDDILGLTL
jgi:hypothetical protein